MNKLLDSIKKLFSRQPQKAAYPGSPKPRADRFTLISWGVTWLIVLAALGFAFVKTQAAGSATVPLPTVGPDGQPAGCSAALQPPCRAPVSTPLTAPSN